MIMMFIIIFLINFLTFSNGFHSRLSSLKLNSITNTLSYNNNNNNGMMMSMILDEQISSPHTKFLTTTAKTTSPQNIELLIRLMELQGEVVVDPMDRKGLNPLLVPLTKKKESSSDNDILCYMRWPTQRDDMSLQLVRTVDTGVVLEAMDTDLMCRRIVAEMDFYGKDNTKEAITLLNAYAGVNYDEGDYLPYLKSGKFPAITDNDLRLVLDRYILTKIGPFPDCYERLANNFKDKDDTVSALVTCERAVSLFYGWGHPVAFHAEMLLTVDRELEAKDAARAALGMPLFTVARTIAQLERCASIAGFSGVEILGEMHAYRAAEERTEEIKEGLEPGQLALDQAAHLMDACSMGSVDGGWETLTPILAEKYRFAGYAEIAEFFESYNE